MVKKRDNDTIILDSVISQRKKGVFEDMPDSDFFEIFTFEQLLKDFDLSDDEVFSGKIDGGDDGGVDGLFFLINSSLVLEEVRADDFKKNPKLDLFLIQSKQSNTFSEGVFEKIITTAKDIFQLSKKMDGLKELYNSNVVEKTTIFRNSYLAFASRHPILKIHVFYASRGNVLKINKKIINKANILKDTLEKLFPRSAVEVKFFGARELLDLSRIERRYALPLNFTENYLSKGEDNYVILSNIIDYYKFSTDDNGNLRRYIFDSNVRDFQGYIEVNKDIGDTLKEGGSNIDFWWLNNGITILASEASIVGKTINLDNVLIVNGLQTTTCIYDYFKTKPVNLGQENEKRSILIKIIITGDSVIRDKIIKATNFQTSIPPASLKATDRIQRNIEDFFKKQDWYYDRRKNFYKNMGKPREKIVSIPFLAQTVMAIVLREPDNARARPSSLIKRAADYLRVFDESINPQIFLFSAQAVKKIEGFSKKETRTISYQEKSNLKFHIAMVMMIKLTCDKNYTTEHLEKLTISQVDDRLIKDSLLITITLARRFIKKTGWSLDRVAKSKEFVEFLKKSIKIA